MRRIYRQIKSLNGSRGVFLLATILVAGIALVLLNLYTVKVSDAIRAYVSGESLYSKGQKEASMDLMMYIMNPEEEHYKSFEANIKIPMGDIRARQALMSGEKNEIAVQGFLDGANHPDDIDAMIWLFTQFHDSFIMRDAVQAWKDADTAIAALNELATHVKQISSERALTPEEQQAFLLKNLQLSDDLTIVQAQFSEALGEASRLNTKLLFYGNTAIIIIILGIAGYFIYMVFKVVDDSRRLLFAKNKTLISSNQKLDSFVYASSHDLKSPINNLEGLIKIFEIQYRPTHPQKIELLQKMNASVRSLKGTINDIENLLKLDRIGHEDIRDIDFKELLDTILEENEMSLIVSASEIETDFEVASITFPFFALKSILYNLVSNAIKYQSPERKLLLRISTRSEGNATILTVSDNGLGIDLEAHENSLFDMFKRFHHQNTGSGLGLYSIKQVIEKNGGSISVESQVNKGTTFVVSLPANFSHKKQMRTTHSGEYNYGN